MQRSLSVAATATIRHRIAPFIAAAHHRTYPAVPLPLSRLVSAAATSSLPLFSFRHSSSVAAPAAAASSASAPVPFQLSPGDKYVVHWRVSEDSGAGKYQQQAVARKHAITVRHMIAQRVR